MQESGMKFFRLSALGLVLVMGTAPLAIAGLRLVGVGELTSNVMADGVRVGGLSGIDYDAAQDRFLAISDDKSEYAPARFVSVKLDYDAAHVATPVVTATTILRNAKAEPYPAPGKGGESLDSESLRLDHKNGTLLITTEGDTKDGFGPAIRRFDRSGHLLASLDLPPQLAFDPAQKTGPRTNLSLEGLSYAKGGQVLWAAMEAPLFQDAPLPTLDKGAPVRFLRMEKDRTRQYVYVVDRLLPPSAGHVADNGVSEILAVDDHHLLVLERAGIRQDDGDFHFFARLYCADTSRASDVTALPSLSGQVYRPMKKKFLFDFATLTNPVADNIEGISWGRRLANGNRSLVLVSDNNFSANHATQFWVLEVDKKTPVCKV
jgi:hypothetical protein